VLFASASGILPSMFTVDEATAVEIRRAYEEGGELAGVVELRRHFPLITDHAHTRRCVRIIVGWQPIPNRELPRAARRRRRAPETRDGGLS
jgi:hypothetical protein